MWFGYLKKAYQILYYFIPFFKCILKLKKKPNHQTLSSPFNTTNKHTLFFCVCEEYIHYKMSTHLLYRTLHKAYWIVATYWMLKGILFNKSCWWLILFTSVWRCTIANHQLLKLTLLKVNMLNENEFIVRRNWFTDRWFETRGKIYPRVHTLIWNDKHTSS